MYFQGLNPAYRDPRPAPAVWAAGLRSESDTCRTQQNRSSSNKPVFTTRTQHLHFTNSKSVGSPSDPNVRHQSGHPIFTENNKSKDYVILYNRSDSGRKENKAAPREPMNAEVRSTHAYYYSPPPSPQRYSSQPEVFQQPQQQKLQRFAPWETTKKTNNERLYYSSVLGHQEHIFTKHTPSPWDELNKRVNPCDVTIGDRSSGVSDTSQNSLRFNGKKSPSPVERGMPSPSSAALSASISHREAQRNGNDINEQRFQRVYDEDDEKEEEEEDTSTRESITEKRFGRLRSRAQAPQPSQDRWGRPLLSPKNDLQQARGRTYISSSANSSRVPSSDTRPPRQCESETHTRPKKVMRGSQFHEERAESGDDDENEGDEEVLGEKLSVKTRVDPLTGYRVVETTVVRKTRQVSEAIERVCRFYLTRLNRCKCRSRGRSRRDLNYMYSSMEEGSDYRGSTIGRGSDKTSDNNIANNHHRLPTAPHRRLQTTPKRLFVTTVTKETTTITKETDLPGGDIDEVVDVRETLVTVEDEYLWPMTQRSSFNDAPYEEERVRAVAAAARGAKTIDSEKQTDWERAHSTCKRAYHCSRVQSAAATTGTSSSSSETNDNDEGSGYTSISSSLTKRMASYGKGKSARILKSKTSRGDGMHNSSKRSAASPGGSGLSLPRETQQLHVHQHGRQSSSLLPRQQKEENYDKNNNKVDHRRARTPRVLRVSRKTTSRDASSSSSASDSFDESSTTQFVSPHSPDRIQTRAAAAAASVRVDNEDIGDANDGEEIIDRVEEEEIEPLLSNDAHQENLESKSESDDPRGAYPVFTHPWLCGEEAADNYNDAVAEEADVEQRATPSRSLQTTLGGEENRGIDTWNNSALDEKPEYSDNKKGDEEREKERNQAHNEMENFFSMRTKSEATSPPPATSRHSSINYKNVKAKVDSNSNTNALHWRSHSSSFPSISSTSPRRSAPALESRPPWVSVNTSRNLRSSTPSSIRGIGEVDKPTPQPHSTLAQSRSGISPSPSRRRHPSFVGLPQKGRDNHEKKTENPDSRSERSVSPRSPSLSLEIVCERCLRRGEQSVGEGTTPTASAITLSRSRTRGGLLSPNPKEEREKKEEGGRCVTYNQQGTNEAADNHGKEEIIKEGRNTEATPRSESERRVSERRAEESTVYKNSNTIRASTMQLENDFVTPTKGRSTSAGTTSSSLATDNALTNSSVGHSIAKRSGNSSSHSTPSSVRPREPRPRNKGIFGRELTKKFERDHQSMMTSAEATRRSSSPSITFIFENKAGLSVKGPKKEKSDQTPQSEITNTPISSSVEQNPSPRQNANESQSTVSDAGENDDGVNKISSNKPRWSSSTHVVRRIDFQEPAMGKELAAPRGNSPQKTMKKSTEVEPCSLARASSNFDGQFEGESANSDGEELHFLAADPTYLAPTVASLAKCTPQGLGHHATFAQSAPVCDDEHFLLSAEKLRENALRGEINHQEKQQQQQNTRSQSPHHSTNENNNYMYYHGIIRNHNPLTSTKEGFGSRRHSVDTNVSWGSIGKASSARTAASSKSQLTSASAGGSTFGRESRWGDASTYPQPTTIRQVVLVRDDVGK